MAHLDSKHTIHIDLDYPANPIGTVVPSIESIEYYYPPVIIQGNTIANFSLSALQKDDSERTADGWEYCGVDSLTFTYGDASEITFPGADNSRFSSSTSVLPITNIDHTYFSSTSGAQELSARVTIVYTQTAGSSLTQQISSLSAVHIIPILQTADNVVDRNLDVLNSQMFTYENRIVPYFNFETDENIIYPMSYFQVVTSDDLGRGIYLNTGEEGDLTRFLPTFAGGDIDFDTPSYFIHSTQFAASSALSAIANSLSGVGFTLQANSSAGADIVQPKLYSFVFSITGDDPFLKTPGGVNLYGIEAISASGELGKDNILTIEVPNYPTTNEFGLSTYTSLFSSISAAVGDNIGPGRDFIDIKFSVASGSDDNRYNINTITFFQAPPLAPPVASMFTYAATSTASMPDALVFGSVYPNIAANGAVSAFGFNDTFTYPHSGRSLSASGRISTDPDANNITVI